MKIKAEYPAKRCEICHQSDQFDPVTNVCLRCQSVVHDIPPDTPPLRSTYEQVLDLTFGLSMLMPIGGLMLWLFAGVFANLNLERFFTAYLGTVFGIIVGWAAMLLTGCVFFLVTMLGGMAIGMGIFLVLGTIIRQGFRLWAWIRGEKFSDHISLLNYMRE